MKTSKCEQCGEKFQFDVSQETVPCPHCQFETRFLPVPDPAPAPTRGAVPADIPRNRHSSTVARPLQGIGKGQPWGLFALISGAALVGTIMANPEDGRDFIMFGGLYLVLALVYFVPSVVAQQARHEHAKAITALNVFAGWTFIGWVAALVWAYVKPSRR